MAIIFSDNFDSYSNGDLNGQGGWGAGTDYDVEGSVVESGAKAVQALNSVNGVSYIDKSFTASGGTPIVSIYVRNSNASTQGAYTGIFDSAGVGWYVVVKSDNTFQLIESDFATSVAFGSGWSANTWYKIEVEVDTVNNRARARVDGGAWSSYVSKATFGTQISKIRLVIGANNAGTSYWDTLSIDDGVVLVAPTVTTQAVTDIDLTTATGNGNVTADGGAAVTERGVCIGARANPTTAGTHVSTSGTTGAFTVAFTGLSVSTHYHVRAYAINSEGTSYGADVEFDTAGPPPWRWENLAGLVYDSADTRTIYAERLNEILDRLHDLDGLESDP